jgi:predicted DNA-binding protein
MRTDSSTQPSAIGGRNDRDGVRVVTRLPVGLAAQLRATAARDGRSVAGALRHAVGRYVEHMAALNGDDRALNPVDAQEESDVAAHRSAV